NSRCTPTRSTPTTPCSTNGAVTGPA
ncbi:uncharacterized protein METZ01_LOCUS353886, partial [marine metagenome]